MKYLKVWTSFHDVIKPLSEAEKGRLFDMMLQYTESGEEPADFAGNERYVWPVAKRDIDMAAEWNETCRKNGSKGGRPRKEEETKDNPEKPTETQSNPEEPNHNLKEKKRNEKKGNEKEKESIKRFTPPTVQEVADYCQERGNNVNPQRFIDFYASKGWKVGNQPMKDWKACVRTWEQRDGGKPLKVLPAQNFPQRDYSDVDKQMMSELEREVMAMKAGGAG